MKQVTLNNRVGMATGTLRGDNTLGSESSMAAARVVVPQFDADAIYSNLLPVERIRWEGGGRRGPCRLLRGWRRSRSQVRLGPGTEGG